MVATVSSILGLQRICQTVQNPKIFTFKFKKKKKIKKKIKNDLIWGTSTRKGLEF